MNHLARRLIPLTFILLMGNMQVQTTVLAYFTADNFTPLIGERVTLTLIVEVPVAFEITEWPEFPPDQYPFEVLETHERTEQTDEQSYHSQQAFTVTIWRPGEFRTPDLLLTYHDTENDETHSVPIEPAFFNVPTQLTGTDADSLRPFKPQIELPYLSPLVIIGFAILFGGTGWYGYRRWQQRRVRSPKATPDITTPYTTAIAALTQLEQNKPAPEVAYSQIAACVRSYIQGQFTIAAHELTTTELLEALAQHHTELQSDLLRDLERLLQQADLVKFAGIIPPPNQTGRLLKFARSWLTHADQHMLEDVEA